MGRTRQSPMSFGISPSLDLVQVKHIPSSSLGHTYATLSKGVLPSLGHLELRRQISLVFSPL